MKKHQERPLTALQKGAGAGGMGPASQWHISLLANQSLKFIAILNKCVYNTLYYTEIYIYYNIYYNIYIYIY